MPAFLPKNFYKIPLAFSMIMSGAALSSKSAEDRNIADIAILDQKDKDILAKAAQQDGNSEEWAQSNADNNFNRGAWAAKCDERDANANQYSRTTTITVGGVALTVLSWIAGIENDSGHDRDDGNDNDDTPPSEDSPENLSRRTVRLMRPSRARTGRSLRQ